MGVEEVSDEGLGQHSNVEFVEAATADAKALIDADPELGCWVTPLVRAIKRQRLRLPVLSPTVNRVVKLIEAPNVDLDELAEAVSGDPVLATRIMGVANSSYFRGASEVPNVREGLMRMGVREARTIVIVVALRGTMLRSPGAADAAGELWQHSLLTATAAQEIASEVAPWESSGFLAGLVHDLGRLVVLSFASELPAWQEDGSEAPEEVVQKISDATHASLGAMVLASWGFPDDFAQAVYCHHDPSLTEGSAQSLAKVIQLGDRLARALDESTPEDPESLDPELVSLAGELGFGADRLFDILGEAEASFEALNKLA